MRIKKNGKVINLTESDLKRIVKKVLNESERTTLNANQEKMGDRVKQYLEELTQIETLTL